MKTEEELEVLYAKFDNDVKTKGKALRFAIVVDQMLGVLFWNNSQDETISSKIGRLQKAGKSTWLDNRICCFLSKLEYNHCNKSIGE